MAPLSYPNEANYYQDESQIEGAMTAAYSQFSSMANNLVSYVDFKSDNFKYSQYYEYSYSFNSYNEWVPLLWNNLFQLVFRSNQVILNMPEDIENEIQYLAEARFLRGYAYFGLVRACGNVPLVTKKLSREEAINMPRESVSDIYAFIESDLQFAVENLPEDAPMGKAISMLQKQY